MQLCYGCCYGCCISQERINVSADLQLLGSSSSIAAHALPILGSTDSRDSVNKRIGVTNRISGTVSFCVTSLDRCLGGQNPCPPHQHSPLDASQRPGQHPGSRFLLRAPSPELSPPSLCNLVPALPSGPRGAPTAATSHQVLVPPVGS